MRADIERGSINGLNNSAGLAPKSNVQNAESPISVATIMPWPPTTRMLFALDEFTVGMWSGDNHTVQIAIAPLAVDHRFKTVLHADVFTSVLRTVPAISAQLDSLDPISDVFAMGSVQNTLRRLVVNDVPVVTGLHAV